MPDRTQIDDEGDYLRVIVSGRLDPHSAVLYPRRLADVVRTHQNSRLLTDTSAIEGRVSLVTHYDLGTLVSKGVPHTTKLAVAVAGKTPGSRFRDLSGWPSGPLTAITDNIVLESARRKDYAKITQ